MPVIVMNTIKGFCNILTALPITTLSKQQRDKYLPLGINYFLPCRWGVKGAYVIDQLTGDKYYKESKKIVRRKCIALCFSTLLFQPIGITFMILNAIFQFATCMPFYGKYKNSDSSITSFSNMITLIFRVVTSPIIFIGLFLSALTGSFISPYYGRKLYASFERFLYAGGKERISLNGKTSYPSRFLLAPCFQPSPTTHLGGGRRNNTW